MTEPSNVFDISSLMPKSEQVAVGSIVFRMREPSILQTKSVLRVASDVELERLVEPFVGLMRGDGGEADTNLDAKKLLERLSRMGSQLVAAARPVLGSQFGPAVESAAIACLDTRALRKKLTAGENPVLKPSDAEADTDDDGTFIGCSAVRAWVKEELTTRQAVHVLTSAIKMIDVVGSVGNLVGALMPEGDETPETPSETAQPTNARKRKTKR